jgi:hypothetical protein
MAAPEKALLRLANPREKVSYPPRVIGVHPGDDKVVAQQILPPVRRAPYATKRPVLAHN